MGETSIWIGHSGYELHLSVSVRLQPLSCREIAEDEGVNDSRNVQQGCPSERIVKQLD